MKTTILTAAAITFGLACGMAGIAYAGVTEQAPAVEGRSIDYGESPSGANINTTQPSGGAASDEMSAPTTGLAGATTGAANMNGPTRNGQPLNPHLMNGDSNTVIIEDGR
jgi:hypothetical protein